MKSSINLLPQQCRDVRRRTRRRLGWCCACAVTAAGMCLAYAWAIAADDTRDRLAATLATAQARQADAERAHTLVIRQRNGYLDSARRLLAVHSTLRLPERLEAIVDSLPDGVYLTDLRATAIAEPPPAATVPAASTQPAAPAPRPPAMMRLELHGVAPDHQTLRSFIDHVERLESFENVELMQATRETRDGVSAVRFRVDCRQVEAAS
ncbi:MAG: PilN domain-containing protein [Phycisphaerales bacterium]|nr:PilN domain-containing protein [Phycisphaerales bacterium]